jgi:hypothetical protein
MEDKRCPVFVDSEKCNHPVTRVDLEVRMSLSMGHEASPIPFQKQGKGVRAAIDSGSRPVICTARDPPRDRAKDGRISAGIPRHPRPGNPGRDS